MEQKLRQRKKEEEDIKQVMKKDIQKRTEWRNETSSKSTQMKNQTGLKRLKGFGGPRLLVPVRT